MAKHSRCSKCQKVFPTADITPLAKIKTPWDKLNPGGVIPSGVCPECGEFCYLYNQPVLALEDPFNTDESGEREYILVDGFNSVWISVGNWSVYISRGYGSQCPKVEVSKRGKEAE